MDDQMDQVPPFLSSISKANEKVDSFALQYPLNDWNNSAYHPSYPHLEHRKIQKEQHTTLLSMLLRSSHILSQRVYRHMIEHTLLDY